MVTYPRCRKGVKGETFLHVINSYFNCGIQDLSVFAAEPVYTAMSSVSAFPIEDFESTVKTSTIGGLLRRDGTYTKAKTGIAECYIEPEGCDGVNILRGVLVREGSYALCGTFNRV
jgi:hypothetical protein